MISMPRWVSAVLAGCAVWMASVGALDAHAASREAVLAILDEIATNNASEDLHVWANEGENLPIEEGNPIEFHFASKQDVHLTAFYLDADGNLVLLYPAPDGTMLRGDRPLVLKAGEATTPYGQESLFVVGSEQSISREALGITSSDPVTVVPAGEVQQTVERLREIAGNSTVISARVDLHIVPTQRTGQGLTRGGIVQYFTEATRSLHRPKLALDIKFETDSTNLLDGAQADLDVVGRALTDDQLADKRFRLVGHTDYRGDDAYNQELSEERAKVAREYLMQKYGIEPERLDSIGLGERVPMMPGTDQRAMSRNRRVELELVR